MNNRDQLVRDLSSAFGLGDPSATRYGESQYDASTGTLYCSGITIPKSTVEKAKSYFGTQMESLKLRADASPEIREMYLLNTVAYNAICMLEANVKE